MPTPAFVTSALGQTRGVNKIKATQNAALVGSLPHRQLRKTGPVFLFTCCVLFAVGAEGEKLVANGQTLLTVIVA